MDPLPVSLAPGERYVLGDELGRGTSGVVLRALDDRLGREVAIKLLHAGYSDDALRRFARESRLAAGFRHANAVEVYDSGMLDGRPFLAMELLRGPSLADAITRTRFAPVHAIIEIAHALADVLAAAHATGLVHRDVKPSNIFVDGPLALPGRIRLVDFGLAFSIDPATATLGRLTADGLVVGTPAYMPPEQAGGDEVGPPADLYALGCVLYELAAGRPPFVGSMPRILSAQLYLPPVAFAELELARPVPAPLEELILALLAKDPRHRPTGVDVVATIGQLDASPRRSGHAGTTRDDRMRASEVAVDPLDARARDELDTLRLEAIELPPNAARDELAIALDGDDPALAAELAAAGIAIVPAERATIFVRRLDDDGGPPADDRDRPIVGLHAAPTPTLIARAIRNRLTSVARWPTTADALRARLHGAIGSRHRLPRG